MAADIWARPVAAALLVLAIEGNRQAWCLAAYRARLASAVHRVRDRPEHASVRQPPSHDLLRQRVWRYALPLVPLGFIGWANGLSDRYIVGGMLSLAGAGIYAARL